MDENLGGFLVQQLASYDSSSAYKVRIFTVRNRAGGVDGIRLCGEHLQELYVHCIFDQIPNLQNCFTTINKNLGGDGASDR
jgi:hypothetical protein